MKFTTRLTVLFIAVAIAAVAIAGSFYYTTVYVPKQLAEQTSAFARKAGDAFRKAFNFTPEIVVKDSVVVEKAVPILELATVSKNVIVENTYEYSPMPFIKRSIQAKGTFVAKAGYDLRERFRLTILQNPLRVAAEFSEPKILSLEMKEYEILNERGNFLNSITPVEREAAIKTMRDKAHFSALGSGILKEAKEMMQSQLGSVLQTAEFKEIKVEFR